MQEAGPVSRQGHSKLGAGSRLRGTKWGQAQKGLGGSVPVAPAGLPVSTHCWAGGSPEARPGSGGVPDPGAPAESSFTSWIPGRLPGASGQAPTGVCPSCCSQHFRCGGGSHARWPLAGASRAVWTWGRGLAGRRAPAPRPHGTVGEEGSHAGGQGCLGKNRQWLWPRPGSALTLYVPGPCGPSVRERVTDWPPRPFQLTRR